jgi:hypothetical protein
MTELCNHESELHITFGDPWIEHEFICKKCGTKKIKRSPIIPFWLADTGHGIRSNFKPYKPPEPPRDDTKKKKHWWQH